MRGIAPLPRPALTWLWFRLVTASFRSVFRRSFSVSGLYVVLLTVVIALVFSLDHEKTPSYLRTLFFLFGPISLSLLILLGLRNGLTQSPFQFTPAETYFLMSSPFSQRDLVSYKLFQYNVMALTSSFLASLLVSRSLHGISISFIKFYLILVFLQALPVFCAVLTHCRETLFSRVARFIVDSLLFLMVASLVAAIYFAFVGQNALSRAFGKLLFEFTRPLFFSSALLPGASPESMRQALLTFLGIDLLLVAVIQLGHSRLEVETVLYRNLSDSRRKIARLKGTPLGALRLGAILPLRWFSGGQGLGPLLWRKIQEYWRNLGNTALVLAMVGLGCSGFSIFMIRVYPPIEETGIKLWQVFSAGKIFVLYATLFCGYCDFRSDTSQITVFRTWPITATRLVWAQVLISLANYFILTALMIGIGAVLYIAYTPFEVLDFTLISMATVPFLGLVVASLNNIIVLALPVSESVLSGRTVGKILAQFGGLLAMAVLLSVGIYKGEGLAAGLAKAHEGNHLWFFLPLVGGYLLVGIGAFCFLVRQFKRFDVSRQ